MRKLGIGVLVLQPMHKISTLCQIDKEGLRDEFEHGSIPDMVVRLCMPAI